MQKLINGKCISTYVVKDNGYDVTSTWMRLLNRYVRITVSLQLWLNKLDVIPQVLKKKRHSKYKVGRLSNQSIHVINKGISESNSRQIRLLKNQGMCTCVFIWEKPKRSVAFSFKNACIMAWRWWRGMLLSLIYCCNVYVSFIFEWRLSLAAFFSYILHTYLVSS